jgi:polyisoprenoid-binding protein YceI
MNSMVVKSLRLFLPLVLLMVYSINTSGETACLVSGRGQFRVHANAGGLLGAFAHDHLIEAQKIEGCATIDPKNLSRSSVKVTFRTADLRVLDPKESADDRAKVQKTMETEVLRIAEYPQIAFESTGVEASGSDRFRVLGNLTIRGKSQPATIPVVLKRLSDGTYEVTGEYKFKQSAFGIKPISLAGGTIKVKDELRTEFDLFLK